MAAQLISHEQFQQLLQEHTEICDLVTTLYRALAERHEPTSRISHLLENLAERVAAHIRDEEGTGLFEELCRRAPERLATIQEVRQEHGALLKALQQLRGLAQEGPLTPETWTQLEDGFRKFSTLLCHHEARENELLQQTYDEDLGDSD